nr:histone deacetylase 14 [Tanacetum cinerariifolium]
AAIRLAMLYDSECWPITKALAFRVEVAELRMLRWTCGKTMVDMISNEVFRAALDVDSIIDKMREGRLRCLGMSRGDLNLPRWVNEVERQGVRDGELGRKGNKTMLQKGLVEKGSTVSKKAAGKLKKRKMLQILAGF